MRIRSLSAIGLSILVAFMVILIVITVAAGFEAPDPAPPLEVIASGLDSPRHLTFGPDGGLYVAEAGAWVAWGRVFQDLKAVNNVWETVARSPALRLRRQLHNSAW